MRLILILIISTYPSVFGDIRGFPIGGIPSVSMKTAFEFFESYANNNSDITFNPRSAQILGGANKGGGSWLFKQLDADGKELHYLYSIDRDLCIITIYHDRKEFNIFLKKDGTPIAREKMINEEDINMEPFE